MCAARASCDSNKAIAVAHQIVQRPINGTPNDVLCPCDLASVRGVMTNALLRVDGDHDEFVEWIHARGKCVDDVLRSSDVREQWHRLLCAMRAWMSRSQPSRCHTGLPRAFVTLEEVVVQRCVVRLLLPGVDDPAELFCVSLASLLALRADDPSELLCAIDAAMTDDEAPQNTSQSQPRVLVTAQ